MKRMQRGIVAVAAAGALVLTGCASSTSDTGTNDNGAENGGSNTLIIGYAAALSGEGAVGDVPGVAGMRYGIDEVNAAGGVNGITLELVVKDGQSDAAMGGTVAQELVDEGAQIIIGPPFPGMASGVLQVAAENNIPVIAGTSTQPEYTLMTSGPVFLAAFGDNVQAAAVAEHLVNDGQQRVFTLSSPDMTYTSNQVDFFIEAFEEHGGELVGEATFSIGQTDFSPQVTSIAAQKDNIDVIYAPMFPPDLPNFVRALRAAGVETPVAGPDGFHTTESLDAGQDSLEGSVFSTHGFENEGTELADVLTAAGEAYPDANEGPALAALGYTMVQVIVAAIEASGSTDAEALTEALQNIEGLSTITGEISYQGTRGVPRKSVTIGGVENGAFVYLDEFVPSYIPEP